MLNVECGMQKQKAPIARIADRRERARYVCAVSVSVAVAIQAVKEVDWYVSLLLAAARVRSAALKL